MRLAPRGVHLLLARPQARARRTGVRRNVRRAPRRARYARGRIVSSLMSSSSSSSLLSEMEEENTLLQLGAQHKRYSGHGSIQELAEHFEVRPPSGCASSR